VVGRSRWVDRCSSQDRLEQAAKESREHEEACDAAKAAAQEAGTEAARVSGISWQDRKSSLRFREESGSKRV
jgi:hypothetical protein